LLKRLLAAEPAAAPPAARIWLGAPNSIKGPTEALFHRQSGNNLLLVGQRDEAILAIFSIGLVSLAAQYPPGALRLVVCDGSPPESPPRRYLERVIQSIPHSVQLVKPGDLGEVLKGLNDEMKQRGEDEHGAEAPATFLLIHGLQKFNKLRYEEEFAFSTPDEDAPPNPGLLLANLIGEGPSLGFHVIASCDSYNNVTRFLSRKTLSEFEMRVLFQMSANDSASLIDNPKASTLGLHRALFFNEQEGYLETFRPYALPGNEWLEEVAGQLMNK
jgi:DNA segregation ATPase FtsK/SpoIIIE, S-DNA-T family